MPVCIYLFGNPSDADKRSESQMNAKQIIFVYRGKRSLRSSLTDLQSSPSKISGLLETIQECLDIDCLKYIFQTFIQVFVDRIYDQTTRFIDIVQTKSSLLNVQSFLQLPKFQFPNDNNSYSPIKIQFSRQRRLLILASRLENKRLVWKMLSALICQKLYKLKNCSAVSINN